MGEAGNVSSECCWLAQFVSRSSHVKEEEDTVQRVLWDSVIQRPPSATFPTFGPFSSCCVLFLLQAQRQGGEARSSDKLQGLGSCQPSNHLTI